MKNVRKMYPQISCLPFAGVTPFHRKIENNHLKVDVKTTSFPSMGGYRFF